MNNFEVEEPILNSPYEEPAEHWYIEEGKEPEKRQGRRRAGYFYRDPKAPQSSGEHEARGQWIELALVNLVPQHFMADLTKGRVLVMNWHVFEPQGIQTGGVSAKVSKAGVPVRIKETIAIGAKTTIARGRRYLTPEELDRQVAAGMISVISEERDKQGNLKKVSVEAVKYVESDMAMVNRVIGKEIGVKQNILVFNDEAHHAYRIRKPEPDESEEEIIGEEEEVEEFFKEATVWVDGLDRIHKLRGINFCVDLSATPYYLGRVGQETNKTFPWVVSAVLAGRVWDN